ncbi:MAG: hypothetical protein SO373_03450, partial [Candidatus Borkfalkiaceae bacterium]|nr:hypothetical protein [Christensenellaceae bacterium]
MSFARNSSADCGGSAQSGAPAAGFKRKKSVNKEEIAGTLLASIPIIGFLIFGLVPLVLALAMAFLHMRGFGFEGATPAGFDNFKTVLTDPVFVHSIGNTFRMGASVLISQVFALFI